MIDPYWSLGPEKEISVVKSMLTGLDEPASAKQLGLVRWMTRKLNLPSYPDIENSKKLCSAFINALMDYEHFIGLDENTKTHIRRIWRGELKNDTSEDGSLPWEDPISPIEPPIPGQPLFDGSRA